MIFTNAVDALRPRRFKEETLENAVGYVQKLGKDVPVFLIVVDLGYVDMEENLYETYLSTRTFPVGRFYYDAGKVMFNGDSDCDDCVLVHNSWIIGKASKVYRFKETGAWDVDAGRYYSNQRAKYLSFDNPFTFGHADATLEQEIESLKTALIIGALLDRIVLLLSFHCRDAENRCSMIAYFKLFVFNKNIGEYPITGNIRFWIIQQFPISSDDRDPVSL